MRPRMRLEVGRLELLPREVRVELRGREVGMAEHLLDRAQVTAAREQVRRKAVPESVRAHPIGEPGRLRMLQDDLVQPLASQRPTAEVDEQLALVTPADHLGP